MANIVVNSARSLFGNDLCRHCNTYYSKLFTSKKFIFANTLSLRPLTAGRDPTPLFFSPTVQQLLKRLTRIDLNKVYQNQKDGQKLQPPEYKFMTTEELNQSLNEIEKVAQQRLQFPPVIKEREEINEVLSRDSPLKGYDTAKYVFTDITYGMTDKDRLIVVRDEDGTLRKASWSERFRMNQLYFPQRGRNLKVPRMFEEEYLKLLLDQEEYQFVLDRACIQFEPDDPDYHRVTSMTYDHIESKRKFEALQSTRHFGVLAFYLAWNSRIDNLLLDNIHNERINDAVCIIQLFHVLNPEAKSANVSHQGNDLPFVQAYIEQDASKRNSLELALQTYLELQKQSREVEEGIQRAHGHNV